MISDQLKEEIRDAADIVEVVGDVVKLKRSGNGFSGLCPFHNERTPSFHVTPRLGIFKCFGCNESGDVFSFLMKTQGLTFPEAMRVLADRYGIELPEDQGDEPTHQQQEREGIYHALTFAGLYYHRQLRESDEAEEARNILHERGFDPATQKAFGLGYAPGGGEQLLEEAHREGIDDEYLLKADLIKPSTRGDGYYDTFRNRLMFPIFHPSGKLIAFGGRVIGDNKRTAKYVNSAQTEVYNKSEVLYGLNFAKNEIRREEEVILVEGYTDVISMHQAGLKHVVSSSGTSLTKDQIRVLKRYTQKMLMIYDADEAGQTAMVRGIQTALEGGMDLMLLTLPDREDPDTFIRRQGEKAFRELRAASAVDFVTFLIGRARESGELDHPSNRAALIHSVIELISRMPDELQRQVYVQHLHQQTQSFRKGSDRELFEELGRQMAARREEAMRERRRAERRQGADGSPTDDPRFSGGAGGTRGAGGAGGAGGAADVAGRAGGPVGAGSKGGSEARSAQAGAGQGGDPGFDAWYLEGGRRSGEYGPAGDRFASTRRKRPGYEKDLLRLLIVYGERMRQFVGHNVSEEYFEDAELQQFYKDIMTRHVGGEEISVEHYAGREAPYPSLLGDIVMERYSVSDRHGARTGQEFKRDKNPYKSAKSVMRHLRMAFFERKRREISDSLRTVESEEQRVKQVRLMSRLQSEITMLTKLSAEELFEDPEFLSSGDGVETGTGSADRASGAGGAVDETGEGRSGAVGGAGARGGGANSGHNGFYYEMKPRDNGDVE